MGHPPTNAYSDLILSPLSKLEEDGSVSGTLVFDLQEKSIADYSKALFNRDQVKRPLHLTREQILTDRGDPNSEAISKLIGDAMQEVIERRQ